MANEIDWPWRQGISVGRTIYACPPGSSHRVQEVLIGMLDTPELAARAVNCHNFYLLAKEKEELEKRLKPGALQYVCKCGAQKIWGVGITSVRCKDCPPE